MRSKQRNYNSLYKRKNGNLSKILSYTIQWNIYDCCLLYIHHSHGTFPFKSASMTTCGDGSLWVYPYPSIPLDWRRPGSRRPCGQQLDARVKLASPSLLSLQRTPSKHRDNNLIHPRTASSEQNTMRSKSYPLLHPLHLLTSGSPLAVSATVSTLNFREMKRKTFTCDVKVGLFLILFCLQLGGQACIWIGNSGYLFCFPF